MSWPSARKRRWAGGRERQTEVFASDYADYRDVNGVMLPFRITFTWLDGRDSIVWNEIKTNVPVDETKFGRHAPLKR